MLSNCLSQNGPSEGNCSRQTRARIEPASGRHRFGVAGPHRGGRGAARAGLERCPRSFAQAKPGGSCEDSFEDQPRRLSLVHISFWPTVLAWLNLKRI